MPQRLFRLPSLSAALLAAAFVLPSPSALAGFQWVPPTEVIAPPAPAQVQVQTQTQSWPEPVIIAPKASAASDVISPVIIGGTAPVASVTSVAPVATSAPAGASGTRSNLSQPVSLTPVVGGAATPSMPVVLATTTVAPSDSDIVHGFAKKVPVAVALRQILPSGYGFSIDPDVDLGTLISFQGGKSWRDTLRDALEPAGLAAREQGQMVAIGRAVAAPVVLPTKQVAVLAASPVPSPLPTPQTVSTAAVVPMMAVATPVSTAPTIEEWRADRGDTLHKVMQSWAARARTELNWVAEYDYPLQASYIYTGSFEDAVRNLLMGFQEARPQPVAELHDNAALGQRVLVVQTRGNTGSD